MQRKDIKPRELLAYRRGEYGYTTPVVVLDTTTLWERTAGREYDTFRKVDGWKCGSDSFYRRAVGYLTVATHGFDDADATQLTDWVGTLPDTLDEDTVNRLERIMPAGLRLRVTNNRHLVGGWQEVREAEKAEAAARAARERAEHARREREQALLGRLETALYSRGIDNCRVLAGRDGTVNIDRDTLARLLDINPDHYLKTGDDDAPTA